MLQFKLPSCERQFLPSSRAAKLKHERTLGIISISPFHFPECVVCRNWILLTLVISHLNPCHISLFAVLYLKPSRFRGRSLFRSLLIPPDERPVQKKCFFKRIYTDTTRMEVVL
ncbi:hypothetical protein CDAR_9851 [Caerostris darwini]|uniref:Uncharacterized protein n=1 Tax=Caerostris darwini TaxID=1538125 RepID=A0AAV4TVR6_9ARAC|nr:hypothetical protein CDAR_9851 [Caerostris darwini]